MSQIERQKGQQHKENATTGMRSIKHISHEAAAVCVVSIRFVDTIQNRERTVGPASSTCTYKRTKTAVEDQKQAHALFAQGVCTHPLLQQQ